jgi:glycosyltransferase involved in cell wall biosynthesis
LNKNLRVAVLNTQPPHLYFGGVERRILEIAKRLNDQVTTTVYSGTKKGFSKSAIINKINLVPCSSTDIVYPLDNWTFNRTISKMFESFKTNIFEAHTVSGYKLVKTIRRKNLEKPFINTVHGVLADEYFQSSKSLGSSLRSKLSNFFMGYLGKIEKEASKEANLIVTVSWYSFKKIVELYDISQKKIRVVPNGVDVQQFRPNEDNEQIKSRFCRNNEHVILFVGNLIPRKGLHYLIRAAKAVLKENKSVKFLIVGDGPIKNKMLSYSKKLGVSEKFVFLGNVSDSLLSKLYNCADVFVSSSVQEGQGITLLEAQATAKPVIAFDVSAIKEVVMNKETGLLIKPDSIELANSILQLISNKSLREKMGRLGRDFVKNNFSWNVCAKKMFEVYSEVLELCN